MKHEVLVYRIKCFIALEIAGHLSMAMMMSLMENLAKSAGVKEKEVLEILNSEREKLNKDNCEVFFDFY